MDIRKRSHTRPFSVFANDFQNITPAFVRFSVHVTIITLVASIKNVFYPECQRKNFRKGARKIFVKIRENPPKNH